jgi:hypothetical protein
VVTREVVGMEAEMEIVGRREAPSSGELICARLVSSSVEVKRPALF